MPARPQPGIPRLLSVNEVAELLRVGKTKVRRLAFEGRLDGHDVAGRMRITEESIQRYLRDSRVGPRRLEGRST